MLSNKIHKQRSTKGILKRHLNKVNVVASTIICLIAVVAPSLNTLNTANALNTTNSKRSNSVKQTKFVLMSLPSAENQIYTKDNRHFVTGSNGIFELIAQSNNSATAVQRAQKQKCPFGGIAEAAGYLYVNCSTNFGTSYLYAAKLTAVPSFTKIYTYNSVSLPNGLTSDNNGRLYVASTFKNQILRLTPSAKNPLAIARTETWLSTSGTFTNGIKYANNYVYWSDATTVKRAALKKDGTPDITKNIFSSLSLSFFDDLSVDNNGILAADYTNGVIRSYDLNGRSLGTIGKKLNGPSSVIRARAPFPANSYIVTERGANQVSLITTQ